MTEAQIVRGQELLEEIQAVNQIIEKLKTGVDAEVSTIQVTGFEKQSKEMSATIRHTTKQFELHLNVSRSTQLTKDVTTRYIQALLDAHKTMLAKLQEELASLGKERELVEVSDGDL